jgi:hypothetical protein
VIVVVALYGPLDPFGKILSEVGFNHVDHLIGREDLLRIRLSLGVKDVVPDVAFKEFGH